MKDSFNQMQSITEEIIDTYVQHLGFVSKVISQAYDGIDQSKEDRTLAIEALKSALATKASLRRKDFDILIRDVLQSQHRQEKQIKENLNNLLSEQQKVSIKLKEALQRCDFIVIKQLTSQMDREMCEITQQVAQFQQEQIALNHTLKSLQAKKGQLNAAEFKSAILESRQHGRSSTVFQTETY